MFCTENKPVVGKEQEVKKKSCSWHGKRYFAPFSIRVNNLGERVYISDSLISVKEQHICIMSDLTIKSAVTFCLISFEN